MKYRARFAENGSERSREVELDGDLPRTRAAVDGKPGGYDAVPLGDGAWSIVGPDGRHVEATVVRGAEGAVRVQIGSSAYCFELLDELTARALSASGPRRGRKGGSLTAAIPGRVLRVLAAAGDSVEAGTPLVVLEAMKMENEVKATRAGRIRSIDVASGQTVGAGDVLLRFEEEP